MKPNELKLAAFLSAVVALTVAVIYVQIANVQLLSLDAFRGLGISLSAVSLFWPLYVRWGWKWPLLSRLFDRPNLIGTWMGELTTDWRGADGQPVGPRVLVLVIRQTLLFVHVTSFTDSFIGVSYAESLRVDRERGLRRVVYLYAKDSTAVVEGWNREGVSELRIEGSPPTRMVGQYWTNTKTSGQLTVARISKTCVESFREALALKTRGRK